MPRVAAAHSCVTPHAAVPAQSAASRRVQSRRLRREGGDARFSWLHGRARAPPAAHRGGLGHPARAMRGLPRAWAGSGSPSSSSPAPEPTPASPAGTTSAPGRAEATGSPGRQRRLPPRAISFRTRVLAAIGATDMVPQGRGAPGSAGPREMVGHDNHWKISVVQSPPWRRTSWARAGPSGRAWKSTKKSRSTSIPPSGWQFTFRSQERSSG